MIWEPDTCNCMIEIDYNYNFKKLIRVCTLHDDNTNGSQQILDNIISHNKSFQIKPVSPPTISQSELDDNINLKKIERNKNPVSRVVSN